MKRSLILATFAAVLLIAATAIASAAAEPQADSASADANAQVAELEKMCETSADARAARHAETTLYERLGKDEGIHRLTKEIVRLHLQNEQIKHMFADRDNDLVAQRVAEFMVSGMGGPAVYKDRPSLTDSHRDLKLTNGDFLSAGGDVIQAMQNLEYGQNEIDEVVCALVGLRRMVVLTD